MFSSDTPPQILAASLQNKIALEMYSICFKILGMKIIFDLLDYY